MSCYVASCVVMIYFVVMNQVLFHCLVCCHALLYCAGMVSYMHTCLLIWGEDLDVVVHVERVVDICVCVCPGSCRSVQVCASVQAYM